MDKITRLLILDKNALELVGLKSLFYKRQIKIQAETTGNVEKIKVVIREWAPNVILFDFHSYEKEIDELTLHVKRTNRDDEKTKVLWLLLEDDDIIKYDAISAGADGCVSKIDYDEISKAVNTVVEDDVYYSRKLLAKFAYEASLVIVNIGRRISLLTEREKEVLEYIRTGATNEDIAKALLISVETVKAHIRKIRETLGVSNRRQLISGLRPAKKRFGDKIALDSDNEAVLPLNEMVANSES